MNKTILLLLCFLFLFSQAQSQTPYVHDPVMIREKGTYYLFCTGMGISVFSSPDMENWKKEKPVFQAPPQWALNTIPSYKGHTWAPDVIFYQGRYHLFYSVSAFGKNTSCIGHASTKTLDPDSPEFGWTDHGKILQSVPNRDMWNAIDPNIILDDEGCPWMTFGSFWGGIKMVKLQKDMSGVAQPEEWYSLASRVSPEALSGPQPKANAIEAPFILRHKGYYYLFVSFDYCCRGNKSNYNIRVGRSSCVSGPYTDREGHFLMNGGGTLVISGNSRWAGVGHNAAYTFNGTDYLIFHGYDTQDEGRSKLIVRPISWDTEEWPTIKL